MKFALLLVSLITLNSSALTVLPFVPAYASDQKNITFDSLGGEISQFQQMSNWHGMIGAIESKKIEIEQNRKSFERAQKLLGTDGITRDEFDRREYVLHLSQGSLNELENRAEMVRVSVETTKLGIMQQGDESKDMRREIAEKMKESLGYQTKALDFALVNAVLTEQFLRKRLEKAQELYNKKAISLVEFEAQQLEHQHAAIQPDVLRNQIAVIANAIDGLNKSLQRLFGQP